MGSCNLAAAEFCYLKLMRSSRLLQGLAHIQGTYANSQNKGHFNSLAAAHIGEGNCYDDPVQIRKNDSRVPENLRESLIPFCCKTCESKGCTSCGQDPESATCPRDISPVIIAKFIHYGCHKVEKQRSKSSLGSKTKQNPITKILSTKESPRETPVGRRFSWFTGNTLRRETEVRKLIHTDSEMASPTLDSICEDDHILDHEDNEVFND